MKKATVPQVLGGLLNDLHLAFARAGKAMDAADGIPARFYAGAFYLAANVPSLIAWRAWPKGPPDYPPPPAEECIPAPLKVDYEGHPGQPPMSNVAGSVPLPPDMRPVTSNGAAPQPRAEA